MIPAVFVAVVVLLVVGPLVYWRYLPPAVLSERDRAEFRARREAAWAKFLARRE